ncbi:interferon omega-2-like [Orycteropus afer afer]|uniref:Interferon omega-2-like n=1 Tax=Orycteropus afer afer TaxID=1230840 RepID=A0A8B7AS08_ORYAF|nr:interferon omega-2-like [Orycteropus afer afer]
MALLLSLLTIPVVLSYGPFPSLGCELPPNHVLASQKTFVLLGQMRRLSPSFCLDVRKDLRFPKELAMGEEESVLAIEGPRLAVKRYFYGMRLYLKEKKYSDCAWEIVRGEIKRTFSSSTTLESRFRRKNGDLASS